MIASMRSSDPKRFRSLADRFSYDEWAGRNRLGEELVVWNFVPSGREVPACRLESVRETAAPGWPRTVQSAWRPAERAKGAGVALVDVFECSSREDAQRFSVEVLGQFESPYVARRDDLEIGDVAFSDDEQHAIVFARANLVILARGAERGHLPIRDLSTGLDRELIEKPVPRSMRGGPEIQRFAAPTGRIPRGRAMPLKLETRDPKERPLWYKCFSSSGSLRVSDGTLLYAHTAPGPPDVTVYAIAPSRAVVSQRLAVSDEPRRDTEASSRPRRSRRR
jgi:hypothetical protein